MIYIVYSNINLEHFSGVKKKVIAQVKVFSKAFGKVYYTIYSGEMLYLLLNGKVVNKAFALTDRDCNNEIINWIEQYNIKHVYIRYPKSSKAFIDFLSYLKNNNIKRVLEFQTYPYDGESNGRGKGGIEDKYYREQLHDYLDCCTTYCKIDSIFGIPCIPLINGIDAEVYTIKNNEKNKKDITLIAVASMIRTHGYERVIEGMYKYYQDDVKRKVYLKLVGDGVQIPYYKRLVKDFDLWEYVEFCGFKFGKELDEIYDESDVGLLSLGFYKANLKEGIGIKACEYMAKGLPLIYCSNNKMLDCSYFAMKVPNDETPIDINNVVKFYDSLQDKDYTQEIHDFCVNNYSWDKLLEPVIQYLK